MINWCRNLIEVGILLKDIWYCKNVGNLALPGPPRPFLNIILIEGINIWLFYKVECTATVVLLQILKKIFLTVSFLNNVAGIFCKLLRQFSSIATPVLEQDILNLIPRWKRLGSSANLIKLKIRSKLKYVELNAISVFYPGRVLTESVFGYRISALSHKRFLNLNMNLLKSLMCRIYVFCAFWYIYRYVYLIHRPNSNQFITHSYTMK